MTLHMLHLPVRPLELMACGRAHRLVHDTWSVDPGYLVHALLARLLGEHAPKPFDLQTEQPMRSRRIGVLAYAAHDIAAVTARAQARADGPALAAVAWDGARSKPIPAFAAGQSLRFRLRACPAVRIGKQHPRFAHGAEVDPYLALIERRLATREQAEPGLCARALKAAIVAEAPSREAVYRDWLSARLGSAASLGPARIVSLRDARLWRRGLPGEGPATTMHGHARPRREGRAVLGRREAVFEGILQVEDATAFAALLARGIGRHRAFGFGMLLLAAAGAD